MKKNRKPRIIAALKGKILSLVKTKAFMAWAASFLVCLVVILMNMNSNLNYGGGVEEFEAGKLANRDVTIDQEISYRDEQATRIRIEAQQRLVPAVFIYSFKVTQDQEKRWDRFRELAGKTDQISREAYKLALQSAYPGSFSDDVLDFLYDSKDREKVLDDCGSLLEAILGRGIFSLPQTGLELSNPDVVELIRQSGSRIEQERVSRRNITTLENVSEAVTRQASSSASSRFLRFAPALLKPFLHENIFYSQEETTLKRNEAMANTEPVMKTAEQGKRIIKKGFIVTEEEMAELRALRMSMPKNDFPMIFANVLYLLLLFGLLTFFSGKRIIARDLSDREEYLVSGLSALYIAGSVLIRNLSIDSMPASVVVPTALVIMLPAILIHVRLALLLAMALPLGAFLTGSFNTQSYIFALVSGVVAAYSLHRAEKRMDLVKAGLFIAAANLAAMIAILLWQRSELIEYPRVLFWAAFNGVASGMMVLGVLPPLENALNAATTFRLIELSDLNAPVMRRLFTVAPGTYSHSIMVANLAEAACQEIGANYLLARVGAYYHDLGKMENPEYFVENQTDYNCHDDMAPRLSATVIRSHVKLGVEKCRQLKLPQEVIDIIAEHHGNSVITWFYDKALKQESAGGAEGNGKKAEINPDDFRYPGSPPRSRESAVVMLADVTEAAVRTLNKPTPAKIEKYIQELFARKEEYGQLGQSELTFKDLEVIKNAFVQVLAGYYHSRIEYPKLGDLKEKMESAANGGKDQK